MLLIGAIKLLTDIRSTDGVGVFQRVSHNSKEVPISTSMSAYISMLCERVEKSL